MRSDEEIERLLLNEIERTRAEFERANEELHSRGTRCSCPGGSLDSLLDAYASALSAFNAFCLEGSVPERLKARASPAHGSSSGHYIPGKSA